MMFSFFKRKPKIEGKIGYYGLADWWLSSFSIDEQKYIMEKFKPLGSSSDLTKGKITTTCESCLQFLTCLAGLFMKKADIQIAIRILNKAESYIEKAKNSRDVHFFFQEKIKAFYKDRENKESFAQSLLACEQQIEFSKNISPSQDGFCLSHLGYEQLCIVREKEGSYSEAIRLAQEAHSHGWAGDWENRIARCNKKLANQLSKN